MEQDREEILNKMQSEKMCSLCGDGAGEMCSPADTDTCGDGMPFVQTKTRRQGKTQRGYG